MNEWRGELRGELTIALSDELIVLLVGLVLLFQG